MTWIINRGIPAARAIDDYQDAHSDPTIKQPKDISGLLVIGFPFVLLAVCVVIGLIMRLTGL